MYIHRYYIMLCAESAITILVCQSIGNEQKCHFGLSGLKIISIVCCRYIHSS